ncbi:MAG: response regulator [Elusimicrobia bacterium]|jgi:CheY-like chemotaxis protein|nr:MAG: response regulator [Elusimicrobiota bacterium]
MSGTVLIVEDDPSIREMMQEALAAQGHSAMVAASGEEALTLLEIRPVDLVIMDLRMPGMNGVETAIAMKHRWPHRPIILCTVCEEWRVREHIGRSIQAYLPKPFTFHQLKDTVETTLAGVP